MDWRWGQYLDVQALRSLRGSREFLGWDMVGQGPLFSLSRSWMQPEGGEAGPLQMCSVFPLMDGQ